MQKNSIDIIVPLYHGMSYIAGLIKQVEECARLVDIPVGLLLISDSPEEPIPKQESQIISVEAFNTDINRGIHGARIFGIQHSHADYIVLLDQDDQIFPEYLTSQMKHIGNSDAVVCNGDNGSAPIYSSRYPFASILERDSWFIYGNLICSPGQVLVRRKAVPQDWLSDPLVFNGADDWLLWILFWEEGHTFSLNDSKLFMHRQTGENFSSNLYRMTCSISEIVSRLAYSDSLPEDTKKRLISRALYMADSWDQDSKKNWQKAHFYEKWISLGKTVPEYLKIEFQKNNLQRIAIYGLGFLGKELVNLLKEMDADIVYGIDNGTIEDNFSFPVYHLSDQLPSADGVIITIFSSDLSDVKEISSEIYGKYGIPCFYLQDFVESWH